MTDRLLRKKGRRGTESRHVRLYHWLLESDAWRSLDAVARALYVEISSRYNGRNNGRIPFSVREAASVVRISKSTASRAFSCLVERGFIVPIKLGAFSLKIRHATEWRLTEHSCDVTCKGASKDFMRWRRPEKIKHGSSVDTVGPSAGTDRSLQ